MPSSHSKETIPASETMCVPVSPFAAEILRFFYLRTLIYDLKAVKKLIISDLGIKQFSSDFYS